MKSFWTDLFEYHHHYNQLLIGELKKHLTELPGRTFPLFCHVLNAHQIWSSRILQHQSFAVNQIHAIDFCPGIDDRNFVDTLQIIDHHHFDREITYRTTRGDQFTNTIGEILFQVANHSTHHKGQIISDFRSQNIEPLKTDYIFYKRPDRA